MSAIDAGLWAITPLDGRYQAQLQPLAKYVSEAALIGYRLRVEAAWLLHLAKEERLDSVLRLSPGVAEALEDLARKTPNEAAAQVKAIEQTTNHDVKAVEYYLRQRLQELSPKGVSDTELAFIHFACTSEDINNLAYGLMLRDVRDQVLLPAMNALIADVAAKADAYADLAMVSRTHGQTASPTTMGKELAVFGHRLAKVRDEFANMVLEGKMNGAVGNYNAHYAAFPEVDWPALSRRFMETRLGLAMNPLTTQIENHDSLVAYADSVRRFNAVALGFARDMWGYISLGYFRQIARAGEVGSSTMPHKVNPIDFENAEGNFGVANALAGHYGEKLPISRWQRDLSDSTVLRSLGTFFGHSLLGYKALLRGLHKVAADPTRVARDIDEAWEVLAEPVQTVMRRYGVVDAYERLKEATRGRSVTKEALWGLVDGCAALPESAKRELKALRPNTYTGAAAKLARAFAASQRDRGPLHPSP